MVQRTYGAMTNDVLISIPLFVLMGFITEQAGLMERLFSAFRMLLAPIRGVRTSGVHPSPRSAAGQEAAIGSISR